MKNFFYLFIGFLLILLWTSTGRGEEYITRELHVGHMAPALKLLSPDGKEETDLSKLKLPVILFFGSYTSPLFLHQSGKMEKMYQNYKDIAEFRIVYIREGHPSNSSRSVKYAVEKGIIDPRNYLERCTVARLFIEEGKITVPVILDNMDNTVDDNYDAWPARVFIIGENGLIALLSDKGPKGFESGLKKAGKWLEEYKKAGKEPEPVR
ncbi:MAG TPA: deiodinase-related protein [Candidatus Eremiobacteraeota bacterium]|nr:MAG: Iodothyronine deiodinase [bacterium ADurb.Bin363]HPZ07708.1 deiodinase-related protein [Candidatus Eremiobacteraeota bacterium]